MTIPESCTRSAKWAAVVDDIVIPLPQRHVRETVITAQGAIAEGRVLVRDHNSPDDVVIARDATVDLAEGNVFYTLSPCDVQPRPACAAPPKLALIVDDRPEITLRFAQSGESVRDLFSLPANAELFRDLENGQDMAIGLTDTVQFQDGPVFYTRVPKADLSITVNARPFTEHDGVKRSMTGEAIASLVYPDNPRATRVWMVSPVNREIGLNETISISGCEVFDVVRQQVDGGYEAARVETELKILQSGAQRVTLVTTPTPAVVYHGLRTRRGAAVPETDVLVPIPGGYPGEMIDWAFLPDDSPLIGQVKGGAQPVYLHALDRTWRQLSYHPHRGGGVPPWNPAVHGFHTYAGELLSWLYDIK